MHASDTHTHTHEGSHSTATETDAMYGCCCCCISSSARVLVRVRIASERERQCVQSFARACDGERASGSVRRKSLRPHNLSLCLLVCVCVCVTQQHAGSNKRRKMTASATRHSFSRLCLTHTRCVFARSCSRFCFSVPLCVSVCVRENRGQTMNSEKTLLSLALASR